MKPFLILLFLFLFQWNVQAQEAVAKFKFQEAEKAFIEERYPACLQNLEEADKILGRPTPAILYLKIEALDRIVATDPFARLGELAKMQEYYIYYLKNYENTDEAKYIDIYKISERYKKAGIEPEMVKGAASGDAKACLELGGKCEAMGREDVALQLYNQSANLNYLPAIIKLSYAYYYGWGVKRDYLKAIPYLKKAADAGDWHANDCLANCYSVGNGVEKNTSLSKQYGEKGFVMTQKEVENGNTNAVFYMGYLYEFGLGVQKSEQKAIEWYAKVDENGTFFEEAVTRRSRLKNKLAAVQKGDELLDAGNYTGAIDNYKKANDELGLRKKFFTAYQKLGEQYLENGQYSLAVSNLKSAFEYNPEGISWARIEELETMAGEEEAYQLARKNQDIKSCEAYLQSYRQGKYADEITATLAGIYKTTAESFFSGDNYERTLEFCQKYLRISPNGDFAAEADKMIKVCSRKIK